MGEEKVGAVKRKSSHEIKRERWLAKVTRWVFAHPVQAKPEHAEPEKRGRRHAHSPFFTKRQGCLRLRAVRNYNARAKKTAITKKLEWMRRQPVKATLQRRAA